MSEEYLKLFKEVNVHLSMSLPGFSNFKKLTGVDNAENVLYWFQRAKALGMETTCNVTVTKLNISELYETLALALLNGASSILLNRFLPGGRGLSYMEELLLTNEQINEMLDVAEDVLSEAGRYGHVGTEIPLCVIKEPSKYKHISIGYKCAAAKDFFVIDPAGQVRCCNHSPVIVGSVFDENIVSNLDYWRIFANSDYHPSFCRDCSKLDMCDCGCREVAAILNKSPSEIDWSIDFSAIKEL
ncbi:radical SAM additional 4Fe4S-binding SPASM domain-containing protein [Succinivibrio dextrinosolvens DSM 3072]|uniref:Radical SAM additional 4Fe4S-binding SPASM domain-containing protein n=1 Tax=Succinivibrio dextrinosolvens DSM 3072 TaxID=1123324 RepID=A0A1T4V1A0_9GAMM|nr:SPASM domain-containing protein [Succinivibrio dextrinosolvens]SKA58674.1 radical SAM additional 4Fe4S-binding SPASM domain-containing protein [Succinivibrio dextrinosolvens DSM 3072]